MKDLWLDILFNIKQRTSQHVYETWFKPLRLIHFNSEKIEIEVPNTFFADWFKKNYLSLFQKSILLVSNTEPLIQIKVNKSSKKPCEKGYENTICTEYKNLNPKYTFSNFIVGASNQFAHAACLAVANHPGRTYNPLFVYSGVGLGKTHLLNAIVHHCLNKNYNTKICYITSENFTNELINSIRYEKMLSFRNKYRNMDLLLLDDIQFIAGKERTQEEFFHTFNALFELKKQIVVTSDKTPREIPGLEERLRSRFEWGLIADIQPPETETKVAILKKKAVLENIFLPNDVAFFLANSSKNNIRELEGLLTRLIAYASFSNCDITIDFAKDVLKNFLSLGGKEIAPEDIIKKVCKSFNLKTSELKTKKRNSSIVLPRQISMYLMKKMTNLSTPEIGLYFGGRDHSTVIHSIKKIDSLIKKDLGIKKTVESIQKTL